MNRVNTGVVFLSGIVGMFQRNGATVHLHLLRAMTDFLAYRGPDRQEAWVNGPAGLGHTMLRTGAINDPQPTHLDMLSITADVRLDSALELRKRLERQGRRIADTISDSMLILHAFAVWGPGCLEYLRGDFGFAIWDVGAKTLFCARDHFGIKPFYYVALGDLFLFSNTLNCLRQHPAVSNELNETAIGDFLLFGLNYDKGTTTFRDIQRLQPGHWLMVSRDVLKIQSYWQPPTQGRIRYTRDQDYVDHFNDVIKSAVADRMTSDPVGILLSGGLDSGSVAAVAKELSDDGGNCGSPRLCTFTVGYESLIPDDGRAYARATAERLGIPNKFLAIDDVELFDLWDEGTYFPEPIDDPLYAGSLRLFSIVAGDCRVAFSGEGADNLMYFQMWPYVQDLGRHRQWIRLAAETASFAWVRPFPWLGIAGRLNSLTGKINHDSRFPGWIAPEFASRTGLRDRWRQGGGLSIPSNHHPIRPKSHASLMLPHWTNMFEFQDPGVTRRNFEVRYPFLDLRMVDYLLAIPSYPWLYKKELMRKAMVSRLPLSLLSRPKSPLSANPVARKLHATGGRWMNDRALDGRINEFVSTTALRLLCGSIEPETLRPFCLDFWLKQFV
jgi:asparagine synthase (glutamine-hydrolysing)